MEFQNILGEKSRVLPRSVMCHPECNEGSPRWLYAVNTGCRWSALRRFFTSFRMTAYCIIMRLGSLGKLGKLGNLGNLERAVLNLLNLFNLLNLLNLLNFLNFLNFLNLLITLCHINNITPTPCDTVTL